MADSSNYDSRNHQWIDYKHNSRDTDSTQTRYGIKDCIQDSYWHEPHFNDIYGSRYESYRLVVNWRRIAHLVGDSHYVNRRFCNTLALQLSETKKMGKSVPLKQTELSSQRSNNPLTRGALARLTGCNIENIRYYEKVGFMQTPRRTSAGYRIYNETDVSRLNFIQKAKALGFSQDAIHELVDISVYGNQRSRFEVKQLATQHRSDIKKRISDLRRIDKRLAEIISHCDGANEPASDCPILESLFITKEIN